MSFFKKLKDRLFRSSSKLEEGIDHIVKDGGVEETNTNDEENANFNYLEPTPVPEIAPEPTAVPEIAPEPTPVPEIAPEPTPVPEIVPEPMLDFQETINSNLKSFQ